MMESDDTLCNQFKQNFNTVSNKLIIWSLWRKSIKHIAMLNVRWWKQTSNYVMCCYLNGCFLSQKKHTHTHTTQYAEPEFKNNTRKMNRKKWWERTVSWFENGHTSLVSGDFLLDFHIVLLIHVLSM